MWKRLRKPLLREFREGTFAETLGRGTCFRQVHPQVTWMKCWAFMVQASIQSVLMASDGEKRREGWERTDG